MAAGQSYIKTLTVGTTADAAMQQFVSATAGTSGYTIIMGGNNTLILTRKYTPKWAIVVAVIGILFFLIGLLALLVKETETMTVTVSEVGGVTKVNVSGQATPELITRLEGAAAGLPMAT